MALIAYIVGLLVWTGQQSAVGGENMYEIIGMANSYTALLWGVSAVILSEQNALGHQRSDIYASVLMPSLFF